MPSSILFGVELLMRCDPPKFADRVGRRAPATTSVNRLLETDCQLPRWAVHCRMCVIWG
jgi:hypothetical protein